MMTREEAIALLNEQYETCKRIYDCSADQRKSYPNVPQFMEALGMALSALRPVSREQVKRCFLDVSIVMKNGGLAHQQLTDLRCRQTEALDFAPCAAALLRTRPKRLWKKWRKTRMTEYIEREALLKAMITSDERINLFQAGIASARAVVASAPTADVTSVEWIRADERLPDDERDGETVLAIVSGKPHENITLCQAIMLAGYFGEEGWLVNEYPEWENPVVTHWMPLPELPKNK